MRRVSRSPQDKKRGGFVSSQEFQYDLFPKPQQQGFSTEDVLWAVGIWSVILTLSPVIVFYMLMVA